MHYNFKKIEEKWSMRWKKANTYLVHEDTAKKKFYVLDTTTKGKNKSTLNWFHKRCKDEQLRSNQEGKHSVSESCAAASVTHFGAVSLRPARGPNRKSRIFWAYGWEISGDRFSVGLGSVRRARAAV